MKQHPEDICWEILDTKGELLGEVTKRYWFDARKEAQALYGDRVGELRAKA